jgi:predicted DNA-binding transcriptional regulator AlpA
MSAEALQADDPLWNINDVREFFGGSGRPLAIATVYRLIHTGVIPAPFHIGGSSRWVASECRAARQRMMAAERGPHRRHPRGRKGGGAPL